MPASAHPEPSSLALSESCIRYISAWEEKIHSFLSIYTDSSTRPPLAAVGAASCGGESTAGGPLAGLPFGVKDNIAVEGMGLSCGSKLLEDFVSPYSATAVLKLVAAGAVPIGKTNLDEFGMGSSCDNSALATSSNPWDTGRVAGGSSGGSAAAVAAGLVPFALGSDTGGSVRQPAAFCGVYGLKPGYGAVSRFGLVAYASSLEGIGILADSAQRTREVFAAIRGADPRDQTSHPASPQAAPLEGLGGKPCPPQTIAWLDDCGELEAEVAHAYRETRARLESLGHRLVPVTLPSLAYAVPAYYTIAAAEASANLARFDTIRYGKRTDFAEDPAELVEKGRSEGFGSEVKLRVLLGTFVLRSGFQDQYYQRAQRIRTGIRADFDRAFAASGASALLMPVFPVRAFPHGEAGLTPFQQKMADRFTCAANLAGLPALAFPASFEGGLPVGLQLVGPADSEGRLLDIAEGHEALLPVEHPAGYQSFWSRK